MKEHLIGGKRNAKSFPKVTEEVRQEVIAFVEAKKKIKEYYEFYTASRP